MNHNIFHTRRGCKSCNSSAWRKEDSGESYMDKIAEKETEGARLFHSAHWQEKRQCAETKMHEVPSEHKKTFCYSWGWSNVGTGCSERLWSAAVSTCRDIQNPTGNGFGQPALFNHAWAESLDDLKRSLPTWIWSQVSSVVSSVQQKKVRNLIQFLDMNRKKNYTAYVVLKPFLSQKSLLPWSLASLNEPLWRWSNISALPDLQSSKKVPIFLLIAQGPPSSPYVSLHRLLTLLFHKKFVGTHLSFLSLWVHKSSAQPRLHLSSSSTVHCCCNIQLPPQADVDFPMFLLTRDGLDTESWKPLKN